MTTTYSILATVTLQHDYYADGRCSDFELVPSEATAKALKGAAILTKTIGNTLILLVKLNDTEATYIDLPADMKLTFYLQLNNTSFVNYTNVPYQSGSVFYFTNLYQTKVGSTLYLNKRVPAFSNASSYVIGDMVLSGANVFEAIKPVSAGAHATGDTAFWFQRSGEQYVHSGDALRLIDGILTVETAAASVFNIDIFSLNPTTQNYDVAVGPTQQQLFTQNVKAIMLDLHELTPAKYRVVVNGVEQYVYVDRAASYGRVFGILELYNRYPTTDDFGLLDGDKKPKGLDHVIRFPNRLAIWKYITRTTTVTGIENTAAPGSFVAAPLPRQFVSVVPMLLKQQPIKTLQVMNGGTVLASRLANPPPERISTHTDGDGNKYFCAEMYLNY
jgi:hypothetical protein